LLNDIKANPKAVAIGGGNYGGVDHVTVATLAETVGVKATDLNYIPYSGGGSLVPDVIGGRVAVGVSGTSEFSSYVSAGKMRVLAVTSPKPLKVIKGKTLVQQGVESLHQLISVQPITSILLKSSTLFTQLHHGRQPWLLNLGLMNTAQVMLLPSGLPLKILPS
jgi:hypothetical protein